jgi:Zn-dependent protease
MGPGAGFLLCALVGILGTIVLGILPTAPELGILPGAVYRWFPRLLESQVHALPRWAASQPVLEAYRSLLWINFWWGVFNLVPIFPLDGGQLAQAFLTMHNPREGVRRGYIVGMITASLLAIYLFNQGQQINAFFVAFLALTNLQLLQAAHYQRIHTDASDDDWWRR